RDGAAVLPGVRVHLLRQHGRRRRRRGARRRWPRPHGAARAGTFRRGALVPAVRLRRVGRGRARGGGTRRARGRGRGGGDREGVAAGQEPGRRTWARGFAARTTDPRAEPHGGDDGVAAGWFDPAVPPPLAFPTDAPVLARLAAHRAR